VPTSSAPCYERSVDAGCAMHSGRWPTFPTFPSVNLTWMSGKSGNTRGGQASGSRVNEMLLMQYRRSVGLA
jgi:hypothetical protein